MAITLVEATTTLLSGKPLKWAKFQEHRAGAVLLDEPGQRRLFEFLLSQDASKVAQGSEDLFPGMLAAWDKESDPAETAEAGDKAADGTCWRLQRIEASGFGGLTSHGGKPFSLWTGGKSWCLEGQNGSGKTSLASAVIWSLTGKRLRDQDGLVDERGARGPVHDPDGKLIGNWPPLVCYPSSRADLNGVASAWVRLTFIDATGETATAFRSVVSAPGADTVHEHKIDPRLLASPQLIETGLLMPARLPSVGFGERSKSLYEAVKMLTGLDQLSDIADGSAAFTNSGRRFLKFAKDSGIDLHASRFADQMAQSAKLAAELTIKLPHSVAIDTKDLPKALRELAASASESAGAHASMLAVEVASEINIQTAEGRDRVRRAVAAARALLDQGAKGVELFQAWKALTDWREADTVATVVADLDAAELALAKALTWHERQIGDKKLRLKAVAARLYNAAEGDCPLCETNLSTSAHEALAQELKELQKNADVAERKLDDACLAIGRDIAKNVPVAARQYAEFLANGQPKDAYAEAVLARFSTGAPFSDVLVGLGKYARKVVEDQLPTLPTFGFPKFPADPDEQEIVRLLRGQIHSLRYLASLAEWWSSHKASYAGAWNMLVGRPTEGGEYPDTSLQARLEVLEQALGKAEPLDAISKAFNAAATECEKWQAIQVGQKKREDIAAAIEPLKQLKGLVNAETASSISDLSGKIKGLLDRIHLRERLDYKGASLGKKAINISGSFAEGVHIDASLVANTSWLRAILWAFVLALREETIAKLGHNPFPLIVLDDPQTTFDPRNKRKWAKEIVGLANLAGSESRGAQILLTTHERQFYQIVADIEKLDGELGIIGGVNKSSGVVTIVNGGCLLQLFNEATENADDSKARDYIAAIRVYCEGLLKIMLQSEGAQTASMSLDGLKRLMKDLRESHVAPFDRKPFEALINTLSEGSKIMGLINHVHHNSDETVGVAEAKEVKDFWESRLRTDIHKAFHVYDSFAAFSGEPRSFPWASNVVEFPSGHKDKLKALKMQQTGIAAAAKTDGRAGDGVITVEEWASGSVVTLPNHEAYQLAAGTLDPVAGIGDVVIVSNYAQINPRNLVVATFDGSLLARRFTKPEGHAEIEVLTGQSTDPYALPNPVLVAPEARQYKKIVGTLLVSHQLSIPPKDDTREVVPLPDLSVVEKALANARLFKVQGRSAEPIALNDQFLITRNAVSTVAEIRKLDGRLVVAFDESGARYFKRLRCHGNIAALESLNPDGTAASELLSFDGKGGHLRITHALEVVGVLFELPPHLQQSAESASVQLAGA